MVGAINTSGTDLLDGSTVFGTLSSAEGTVSNNTPLTITFNANATNARVQQTVRAIHYRNNSDNPGTGGRTITFKVTDNNNGTASDSRTVSVTAVNDPPTITSTAGTTATEDTEYTYTATVNDPDDANDGTNLTWSLTNAPSGMVVSNTGVVTWTPAAGTTSGLVTLTVADGGEDGATPDSEDFTISVTAVNEPPIITSTAGTTATEDTEYTYAATVNDPDDANDGTNLTWSLTNAPSGMVVSNTGVVTWTPKRGFPPRAWSP